MAPGFEVCVVGGGVVGTAVCRELARRGVRVVLVDKRGIGSGVSAGNTGIACTTLGVSEGTVERACLERGLQQNLATYKALGIPHRACGALYVAWTPEELAKLRELFAAALESEPDATLLSAEEVYSQEPKLGRGALGGMFVPGEVLVDPGLVPLAYAHDATRYGASVVEGCEVVGVLQEEDGWRLHLQWADGGRHETHAFEEILAEHIVNCGGLDADRVQQAGLGCQEASMSFRPRRGDYIVFRRPSADVEPPLQRPVGSVPMPSARGVYVWPTIHGDVACGPTNEEQDHKSLPKTMGETLDMLRAAAFRVCPEVRLWDEAGSYAGLRPALEPSAWGTDYVVRTDAAARWTLVAGVRSTGLTASLGIAAAVADAIPASSGNSVSSHLPQPVLPPVEVLARDFCSRGDGAISLEGRAWHVRHPLTRVGLGGPARPPPLPDCSSLNRGSLAWIQTRSMRTMARRGGFRGAACFVVGAVSSMVAAGL